MRLLFVDDEPHVLQGLQRMLRRQRHEWQMCFTDSGDQALALLDEQPFDVVVSDIRMPGMDGVELLTRVRDRLPGVVRIILSGHCDEKAILRAVGPAHQYLSKPCDADTVISTINRSVTLRSALKTEALKASVSRMQSLPSLPAIYKELVAELQSDEPSIRKVGEIVSKDVAMSAKVLQLVNSAFFGLSQQTTDAVKAVMHLGTDTVRNLALSTEVFNQLEGRDAGLDVERIWNHSTVTAALAKEIATAESAGRDFVDAAFQAGFLCDIGKLVLSVNLPREYAEAAALAGRRNLADWASEAEVFGATHGQVGGYLLGIWGLPDQVVEAVTFHHNPSELPEARFSPLTVVHAADAFAAEIADGRGAPSTTGLDHDHLAAAGVADRLESWNAMARRRLEAAGVS